MLLQMFQRLLASFQENQYPERATKESLARELGLSLKQVMHWVPWEVLANNILFYCKAQLFITLSG